MPTLAVDRDDLFTLLGHSYTDEEFDELCFLFGVELDEITSEREEALKSATVKLSKAEVEQLSDKVLYKIDVPANRYDLLCLEGLSRALKIFNGEMDTPRYSLSGEGENIQKLTVFYDRTSTVRPFVVSAILRDVTFTPQRYKSFIELQDQLHRNLCRNRTLVAIGTHDADTIEGPFAYDARPPEDISFVPLTHSSYEGNSRELLDLYSNDPAYKHLKPYVPIIQDSALYPVVLDKNETVLSLPPLINGDHSKITLDTKNVFIECTATDLTKANIVLDTVVCMFSEYCSTPFQVEPVEVKYVHNDGSPVADMSYTSPQLLSRREKTLVSFVNSLIGIDISADRMAQLCEKLQLAPAQVFEGDQEGEKVLEVTVPPTRSDILHAVDIAEDIGIAYGYNNIRWKVPSTCTVGGEQKLNHLGDLLREEISRAGYTEVLTHGLCSLNDNFTALRRPVTESVSLSNPANAEYQVVRTTLLPGLLKTLQHNKSMSFTKGFKLFEISDVVLPDDKHLTCRTIVGARNERRVCAVYAGPTSGFEIIHGLVDRILSLCEVCPDASYAGNSAKGEEERLRVSREGWFYTIEPPSTDDNSGENAVYFPGRCAEVWLKSPNVKNEERTKLGSFGILHPAVLKNFDIQYPCSCLELNLEPLL